MTRVALAKKTKIQESKIVRICNGSRNPSLPELDKIMATMKLVESKKSELRQVRARNERLVIDAAKLKELTERLDVSYDELRATVPKIDRYLSGELPTPFPTLAALADLMDGRNGRAVSILDLAVESQSQIRSWQIEESGAGAELMPSETSDKAASEDSSVSSSLGAIPAIIRQLGELRDAGYLTDGEFQHKKQELLGRL